MPKGSLLAWQASHIPVCSGAVHFLALPVCKAAQELPLNLIARPPLQYLAQVKRGALEGVRTRYLHTHLCRAASATIWAVWAACCFPTSCNLAAQQLSVPAQGPSCPAGTSPLHHLAGVKLRALEGGCCGALPRALLGAAIRGHGTGVAVLRVLSSLLGSLAGLAHLGLLQPSLVQDCINLLLCLQTEGVSLSEQLPVVKTAS